MWASPPHRREIRHKVGDSMWKVGDSTINITLCFSLSSLRNTFVETISVLHHFVLKTAFFHVLKTFFVISTCFG